MKRCTWAQSRGPIQNSESFRFCNSRWHAPVFKHVSLVPNRITVLRNHTLQIVNASRADEGSYVCRAENQFGSAEMTSSLLVKGEWLHYRSRFPWASFSVRCVKSCTSALSGKRNTRARRTQVGTEECHTGLGLAPPPYLNLIKIPQEAD